MIPDSFRPRGYRLLINLPRAKSEEAAVQEAARIFGALDKPKVTGGAWKFGKGHRRVPTAGFRVYVPQG